MLVGFLVIATVIGKSVSAPYAEWAKGQIEKVKSILNSAREEHTRAVTDRIDSVGQLKEVVPLTESLYAVAKETNQLEHENFILAQENAVKAELKSVLDSWVRYEQQQREAEQIALVKTVQANVEAELAKPAFKKQLLEEALAQVERESFVSDTPCMWVDRVFQRSPRARLSKWVDSRWKEEKKGAASWRVLVDLLTQNEIRGFILVRQELV